MARISEGTEERTDAREERGRVQRLRDALDLSVDASSLAVFRIGFGSIIAWEVWRAYEGNQILADYETPAFLFKWWYFRWVEPLPGVWLYVAFALLGLAAFALALGLFHRAAAAITCVLIAYWILMEKAAYLNHRYLAALFAFLFLLVPANAAYSVDARRRSSLRSATVPAWPIWLMRFQVGVPYFFAGIAKLNFDWLVRAEPLRARLALAAEAPLIGPHLTNPAVVYPLAWGATALDTLAPFLLLHRRTRAPAYGLTLAFHFINSRLFDIGIFPWMMIVATTVFFEPDWPRRLAASWRGGKREARAPLAAAFVAGALAGSFMPQTFSFVRAFVGGFGVVVLVFHLMPERLRARAPRPRDARAVRPSWPLTRPLAALLAVWVAAQLLVPLRHFAIPGNVHWTEEGNRFAWHMLLRNKQARLAFRVTDPATGETWTEDLNDHLTPYQRGKVRLPDLILEFAHYLEDHHRALGRDDVEVRVLAIAILNGRPHQRFIRTKTDLTKVQRPYIGPARWIVPLKPYED